MPTTCSMPSSSLASTSPNPPRTPRKPSAYTSITLCARPAVGRPSSLASSVSTSSWSSDCSTNGKNTKGPSVGELDREDNKENIEPEKKELEGELDEEEELLVMTPPTVSRKRTSSSSSSRSGTTDCVKRTRLERTESVSLPSLFTTSPRSSSETTFPVALPSPPPTPAKSIPTPSIYALARSLLRCSTAATTSVSSSNISSSSSSTGPLIGRSTERDTILSFVDNAEKSSPKMLYVAGQPGTGKTALVSNVATGLVDAGWTVGMVNCVGAKNIWETCASELGFELPLKGATTREVLLKVLRDQRKTKFLLVLDELDSLISLNPSTSTSSPASLLLLESLFTLPSSTSNLHIISIANSLDLPSRHFSHLATPPLLLSFRAYVFPDLKAIIRGRLRSLLPMPEDESVPTPLIDDKAIELAARKGEAKDGDLRMCLDVCRMSIEAVEGEQRKKALASAGIVSRSFARTNSFDVTDSTPLTPGPSPSSVAVATHFASFTAESAPRAGLKHVLQAFKTITSAAPFVSAPAMARSSSSTSSSSSVLSSAPKRAPSSATISKIKSLNIQSRLILVALLVHSRRSSWNLPALGTPSRAMSTTLSTPSTPSRMSALQLMCTTTAALHSTYHHLLSSKDSPLTPVNRSDFLTLLSNLADSSLLTLSPLTPSKRKSGSQAEKRVDLMCMEEEVVKGLVVSGESSDGVVEEEARRILQREEERIVRTKEVRRKEREREAECPLEDRL